MSNNLHNCAIQSEEIISTLRKWQREPLSEHKGRFMLTELEFHGDYNYSDGVVITDLFVVTM